MAARYTILFLHKHLPGQFTHVIADLAADPGVRVLGMGGDGGFVGEWLGRVEEPADADDMPEPLRAILRGRAVGVALAALRDAGLRPDLVVGHGGWGDTVFVKDVWPRVPLLDYFEFHYAARGRDLDFDPEFPADLSDAMGVRAANAVGLLALDACDLGVSPTRWQRSLFPEAFQRKIVELHDGIDTDAVAPFEVGPPKPSLVLPDGTRLAPGDPIVTFVARTLEPYRGFHVFMRALPRLQRLCPRARVVIVGADGAAYGRAVEGGYRARMLAELGGKLDLGRVHFTGALPRPAFLHLLRLSAVHAYLTYPFVLSWSLLEAMASGCLVVASATPPVREVVEHGRTGLLVDFFDHEGLADALAGALGNPASFAPLRDAARRAVAARYDARRVTVPAWRRLLAERFDAPAGNRSRDARNNC